MRGATLRGGGARGGIFGFIEEAVVEPSVETYLLNTNTLGITQFSGDEWDGALAICSISGKRLLIKSDGLYEMTGTASAAGAIKTSKIFLSRGALFKIFRVDAILKADNPVSVTVYSEYNGVESAHGPYTQDPEGRAEFRKWKFKVARGHRGASYVVKISCAGQWECRGINLHTVTYPRRRR